MEFNNEYKEYIIKNNINLTNEISLLREENQNLKLDISQKEEEIDNLENRIRYSQGYLHNLNEIKELSLSIYNDYKKYTYNLKKFFNKTYLINSLNRHFMYINLVNYIILYIVHILIIKCNNFNYFNLIKFNYLLFIYPFLSYCLTILIINIIAKYSKIDLIILSKKGILYYNNNIMLTDIDQLCLEKINKIKEIEYGLVNLIDNI
jgi:hypothetical protein